jgi:hypothetical protein
MNCENSDARAPVTILESRRACTSCDIVDIGTFRVASLRGFTQSRDLEVSRPLAMEQQRLATRCVTSISDPQTSVPALCGISATNPHA